MFTLRQTARRPFAGLLVPAMLALVFAAGPADAQAKKKKIPAPPEMTAEYLADPANIAVGKQVWEEQCRHCHGKNAYPGKAPKLKPKRYRRRPEFVWDRVTNGFRKMPAWDEAYTAEERMGVVAYIVSKSFSP